MNCFFRLIDIASNFAGNHISWVPFMSTHHLSPIFIGMKEKQNLKLVSCVLVNFWLVNCFFYQTFRNWSSWLSIDAKGMDQSQPILFPLKEHFRDKNGGLVDRKDLNIFELNKKKKKSYWFEFFGPVWSLCSWVNEIKPSDCFIRLFTSLGWWNLKKTRSN